MTKTELIQLLEQIPENANIYMADGHLVMGVEVMNSWNGDLVAYLTDDEENG